MCKEKLDLDIWTEIEGGTNERYFYSRDHSSLWFSKSAFEELTSRRKTCQNYWDKIDVGSFGPLDSCSSYQPYSSKYVLIVTCNHLMLKRKKTRHLLNITDDVSPSGYCAIVSVGLLWRVITPIDDWTYIPRDWILASFNSSVQTGCSVCRCASENEDKYQIKDTAGKNFIFSLLLTSLRLLLAPQSLYLLARNIVSVGLRRVYHAHGLRFAATRKP